MLNCAFVDTVRICKSFTKHGIQNMEVLNVHLSL